MDSLESLLKLLTSGEWKRIDNLAQALDWQMDRLSRLCSFLSQHGLLEYRGQDDSVRLDPKLLELVYASSQAGH